MSQRDIQRKMPCKLVLFRHIEPQATAGNYILHVDTGHTDINIRQKLKCCKAVLILTICNTL